MICNIIDSRTRPYRWRTINAIVEPTSHDNSCADTDEAEETHEGPIYAAKKRISLLDAVKWASELPGMLTLYLYDEGGGCD